MDELSSDPGPDQHSKAHAILAVCVLFLVLVWTSIFLRIWVRACMIRSFGLDDWMMVIAAVLFSALCAFLLLTLPLGGGGTDPPLQNLPQLFKYFIASETFYIVTAIFLKLSLGLFLLRIVTKKWHIWFIYVVMALSTSYGIVYFFVALFQCGNPQDILVNKLLNKCLTVESQVGLGLAHAGVQAATDWSFAILPVFVLWDVQMPRRTKIVAGVVLSLGACGSAASCARFQYVKGLFSESGLFFSASNSAIIVTIEAGLGIFAGSLATLRPLLRSCVEHARKYTSYNKSGKSTGKSTSDQSRQSRPFDNPQKHIELTTTVVGNHQEQFDSPERDISLEDLVPKGRSSSEGSVGVHGSHEDMNNEEFTMPAYQIERRTNFTVLEEHSQRPLEDV